MKINPSFWIYDMETDLYICPCCGIPVAAPEDDPQQLPDTCPICCHPLTRRTSPIVALFRTFGAQ